MTFYITTPIYYVNDVPHLGHAYTTICADAFARFHRMRGEATRMLTGTDEHGQKVEEAAHKRGISPKQHVDEVAPRFATTWRRLGISHDDFIRTTEPRHAHVLRALWRRIVDAGDLYLASYDGWYCVGCEAFYTESALTRDGDQWLCPIHKRPVAWVAKERTWFFRLSKYQQPLLDYIEQHPEFVQPEAYRNEVVAFVKSGLRDLSVSRTSFSWGVPIPDPDPEGHQHVMYVWMDALTNYLSALVDEGAADPFASPLVQEFWPEVVHLIGKDILRFHAVYWPSFLLSAGLPLPKTIYSHGWWTVRGEKISKSMPATRIDPILLARALGGQLAPPTGTDDALPGNGIDAMRYYLLREIPLGNDGDFTFESLFARYNSDLANDLGNLVNRASTLLEGQQARIDDNLIRVEPHSTAIKTVVTEAIAETEKALLAFSPSRALEAIWKLVRECNRYVDANKPWIPRPPPPTHGSSTAPASDAASKARHALTKTLENIGFSTPLEHILGVLHAALTTIAALIYPVLPHSSAELRKALRSSAAPDAVPKWPTAEWPIELVKPGEVRKSAPLFPRFDAAMQDAIVAALVPDAARAEPAPGPAPSAPPAPTKAAAPAPANAAAPAALPSITYDDFARLELRVGKVLSAVAVPKAKKLLQLSVDLGEAAPRTIVAGIAEAFAPDTLLGKQVIVVANLAPATIRGIRSEGMILAAGEEAILGLSAVDADVPPGTRVR
jgi:methionyl-tRNA synthetase